MGSVCLRVMFRVELPLSALIGDISLIQRELGSPVRRSQKQQALDSLQSSARSSSSSTSLLQPVAVLVPSFLYYAS